MSDEEPPRVVHITAEDMEAMLDREPRAPRSEEYEIGWREAVSKTEKQA